MTAPADRGSTDRTQAVRRSVSLARAALAWERIWVAAWPPASVAAAFVVVALLDGFSFVPGWLHAAALVAFAGIAAFALFRAVCALVWPSRREAVSRVETASGLEHRPIEALADRLPEGAEGPEAGVLWQAHREQMARQLRDLRAGMPAPGLPARDPWAFRTALGALLLVGFVVAGPDTGQRLERALAPNVSLGARTLEARLEFWITPPAYTRLAPVFPLRAFAEAPSAAGADDDAPKREITVPAGSELMATITGGEGDAEIRFAGTIVPFTSPEPGTRRLARTIDRSGRLEIRLDGHVLATWTILSVPDSPPRIAFAEPPEPFPRGTLRLTYKGADDYGIVELRGEMRRTYERGTVIGKEVSALELAVPPPDSREFAETSFQDFAPHPWAGLPVAIRLIAKDAAGQETVSDEISLMLPERDFRKPVARQIVAERRRLTTAPERRPEIVRNLGRIGARPAAYGDDKVVFMGLAFARSRLLHEQADSAIPAVRDLLWDTALRVEDGNLSLSEKDLLRAEAALRDALARDADQAELQRLVRELQQALDRYLRELARRIGNTPADLNAMPFDPRQAVRFGDLREMLRQIGQMMRSGNRETAADMLAQLRQMLEGLRNARLTPMSPDARFGNRAFRQLRELIRRQGGLMDRTFRQSQQPGNEGEIRQGFQEQQALEQMLQRLREMLQQGMPADSPAARALERARQGMGEATRALGQGQPGEAVGPQGQAMEALRRAGQGLMQEMRNRMGQRGPGQGFGRFSPLDTMRDPLGRDWEEGEGGADTRRVNIPDQDLMKKAREIIEELRKRAGQQHRTTDELEYIDRLLDRF